jgi:hypothetical protein
MLLVTPYTWKGKIVRDVYAAAVHNAKRKIRKGDIRNTVLRQLKALKEAMDHLQQGRDLKSLEVAEFKQKDSDKTEKLKRQIAILDSGIGHIGDAINKLEEYKDVSVSH